MIEISWSCGAPIRHRPASENTSYFLEFLLLAISSELLFVFEGLFDIQVLNDII